ncbi:MAG: NAD(P)-dependent oxidoreductase, partial [Bdellovibrionales bacterium]|nr:NAD(P)-dependent oxidoreductase [Bdellovibrionales bacterium]
MKIVVTGATGFLGKHLCLKLLHEGHQLVVLTRDSHKAQYSLGLPAEYFE